MLHRCAFVILFAAFLAPSMAGCGFQPLYADNYQGVSLDDHLSDIEVIQIPQPIGQEVYIALMNELTPLGTPAAPLYQLKMTLRERKEGLGFEEDDNVTRYNYQLISRFRLVDMADNKTVFEGETLTIAPYNVVSNQFSTLTAQRDAQRRAASELSREVKLRLSLYFRQAGMDE